eukprot:5193597-Prorocentrum_lima.AAC.1
MCDPRDPPAASPSPRTIEATLRGYGSQRTLSLPAQLTDAALLARVANSLQLPWESFYLRIGCKQ